LNLLDSRFHGNDRKGRSPTFYEAVNVDEFVKSRKTPFFVIPAKAGIQSFWGLAKPLDPGFHRGDDFLRTHQCSKQKPSGLEFWSFEFRIYWYERFGRN
jgi:hypothetical protein